MSIDYTLIPNRLTNEPNLFAAQVKTKGTVDLDALARAIAGSGSTTAESDILAVLTDARRVIETFLLAGHRVDLGGLVSIAPRIRGRFEGPEAGFEAERHRLDLYARVGTGLRKRFQTSGTVNRIATAPPTPLPSVLEDTATATTNATITTGRTAILRGQRLKIDPAASDEGIYLTALSDGSVTRISGIVINHPRQLVFEVPADLPPGDYTLHVRARTYNSKTTRTGHLNATLTAVTAT